MAGHYFETVENNITGKPVANATILVYSAGATVVGDAITAGTLATVFSDDGVTQIDQSSDPITTNSRGFFEFWTNETSVCYEISYDGEAKFAVSDVEIIGGSIGGDVTALAVRVSATEVITQDATIVAFKGLTGSADTVPYFTGTDTMSTTALTSFARTLIDDASASAARTTLGLVIGTDVQAYSSVLAAIVAGTHSSNVKPLESMIIACSDETTALTAGTAKVTFRMPYAFTLTAVYCSLTTAQTSGNIFTVDINEGASSILSTKLTIDNGEDDSADATTAAVISDSSLASRAKITVDIDQIGDGTAKGLKVTLVGYRT